MNSGKLFQKLIEQIYNTRTHPKETCCGCLCFLERLDENGEVLEKYDDICGCRCTLCIFRRHNRFTNVEAHKRLQKIEVVLLSHVWEQIVLDLEYAERSITSRKMYGYLTRPIEDSRLRYFNNLGLKKFYRLSQTSQLTCCLCDDTWFGLMLYEAHFFSEYHTEIERLIHIITWKLGSAIERYIKEEFLGTKEDDERYQEALTL